MDGRKAGMTQGTKEGRDRRRKAGIQEERKEGRKDGRQN